MKEDGFTFSLHPLFFAFGVYYALTGRLLYFLICTASAVLHELGHTFVATKNGYLLKNLSLMPYGATISGDFDGVRFVDELAILLAGPFLSLLIAFLTTASWWFFPDTYPYTEYVFWANLSIGLVNLLPVKPLDGGRILSLLLRTGFSKTGDKIFKVLGVIISLFFLTTFFAFIVNGKGVKNANFTLLFFSLFILFGVFEKGEVAYKRAYLGVSKNAYRRGVLICRHAVGKDALIKRVLALLSPDKHNEIYVVDYDKVISQKAISERLCFCPLYSTIEENYDYLFLGERKN